MAKLNDNDGFLEDAEYVAESALARDVLVRIVRDSAGRGKDRSKACLEIEGFFDHFGKNFSDRSKTPNERLNDILKYVKNGRIEWPIVGLIAWLSNRDNAKAIAFYDESKLKLDRGVTYRIFKRPPNTEEVKDGQSETIDDGLLLAAAVEPIADDLKNLLSGQAKIKELLQHIDGSSARSEIEQDITVYLSKDGLTGVQVFGLLEEVLGREIPEEHLSDALSEAKIAFLKLRSSLTQISPNLPEVDEYRVQVSAALEKGDLQKADMVLQKIREIKSAWRENQAEQALNDAKDEAKILVELAEISLARSDIERCASYFIDASKVLLDYDETKAMICAADAADQLSRLANYTGSTDHHRRSITLANSVLSSKHVAVNSPLYADMSFVIGHCMVDLPQAEKFKNTRDLDKQAMEHLNNSTNAYVKLNDQDGLIKALIRKNTQLTVMGMRKFYIFRNRYFYEAIKNNLFLLDRIGPKAEPEITSILHNNIGNAYNNLAAGFLRPWRRKALANAIKHFETALSVETDQVKLENKVKARMNLAAAKSMLALSYKKANALNLCDHAIELLKNSTDMIDNEEQGLLLYNVRNRLAYAYRFRSKKSPANEKLAYLEKANSVMMDLENHVNAVENKGIKSEFYIGVGYHKYLMAAVSRGDERIRYLEDTIGYYQQSLDARTWQSSNPIWIGLKFSILYTKLKRSYYQKTEIFRV